MSMEKKRNSILNEEFTSKGKTDHSRLHNLQTSMEKKLNQIVEQLSNQIIKQRLDINDFKSELDIFHTTLELVSRQIKEQLKEIGVMQNFQLETIEKKFVEFRGQFEQQIQEETIRVRELITSHQKQSVEPREEEFVQQVQMAVQDSQIESLNGRLNLLEKQMQAIFRKFDVRQDDEKQAMVLLNLLKNDRKLQEVFQAKFRQDATEVFENGLGPFRLLMETRISTSMQNIQTFSLAIRKMERNIQEQTEMIDVCKRETINISKNIDKSLQSYQEELEKVSKIVPEFTEFQELCDEQIQTCQSEIVGIRSALVNLESKFDKNASCVDQLLITKVTDRNTKDDVKHYETPRVAKDERLAPVVTNGFTMPNVTSEEYLNQVEKQIKKIYKQIKLIRSQDGEIFKSHFQNDCRDSQERRQSRSQLHPRRVELIPKPAEIQYLNNYTKTVKLKHQSFINSQMHKDMFIPIEKTKFLNQKGNVQSNQNKLYQHIISDEQFYLQYKSQIDEIQERLNLKFEVSNIHRKSPSPLSSQRWNDERQATKYNSVNFTSKIQPKEEEHPLSINNRILRNRKQGNINSLSHNNSRNVSRSEDHQYA